MKRGISPIVAIVLLIAIAVIAAVGIYFWMSGLATKQPTPTSPVSIVANPIGHGKVLIANLGQKEINTSSLKTSDPNLQIECEKGTIAPGEQVLCVVRGNTSSSEIAIWGNGTGSTTIPVNKERVDNPPSILWVKDNSTDGEMLLGDSLEIQAKVTDDVGVSTVWLNNGSADIQMHNITDDVYEADITPKIAGSFSYFVKANDTSDQWTQSESKTIHVIDNWMRAYGGSDTDRCGDILEIDNGYLIVGTLYNTTTEDYDILVMKVNSSGNIEWAKTYGGGNNDYGIGVLKTTQGYILIGQSFSFDSGDSDVLVMEIDEEGNVKWAKVYGGDNDDNVYHITSVNNGYLVVGSTYSFGNGGDALVMKLDENGDVTWAKVYGGNNAEELHYALAENNGKYILIGDSGSYTSESSVLVMEIDNSGNVTWAKVYNTNNEEHGYGIIQDDSSGYIFTGRIGGYKNSDILTVKIDNSGNVTWAKIYGGDSGDYTYDIAKADGNYVIVGRTGSYGNSMDALVMEINEDGNVTWAKIYGEDEYDGGEKIKGTNTGYIVIGETVSFGAGSYDILAMKLNESGDLKCGYYSDITNEIGINIIQNIENITVSIEKTNITDQINETPITSCINVTDVSPTETCICQPFGC